MMKKNGGLIKNWQVLESDTPGSLVFSGTVVEDAAGRFQPGDYMRSSYIVYIDREKGIIETVNTIYKVINEIKIHEKGQYKFVRISDLPEDDQKAFKKFLDATCRNAPLPPGETPGNTAWPHDYQDFARGADPGEFLYKNGIL